MPKAIVTRLLVLERVCGQLFMMGSDVTISVGGLASRFHLVCQLEVFLVVGEELPTILRILFDGLMLSNGYRS